MKQFIGRYFLFIVILFTLFYAPTSIISTFLNDGQTKFTLYMLAFFLEPHQLQGVDIWINPHYKVFVSKACNGSIPILILYASILAYPSKWTHKIVWMLIGYVVFSLMNVFRILLVVYATQTGEGRGEFYWSHDIVGNLLLMFTGLILFVLFIKTAQKQTKSFES